MCCCLSCCIRTPLFPTCVCLLTVLTRGLFCIYINFHLLSLECSSYVPATVSALSINSNFYFNVSELSLLRCYSNSVHRTRINSVSVQRTSGSPSASLTSYLHFLRSRHTSCVFTSSPQLTLITPTKLTYHHLRSSEFPRFAEAFYYHPT
jgi:hypothetical protein